MTEVEEKECVECQSIRQELLTDLGDALGPEF